MVYCAWLFSIAMGDNFIEETVDKQNNAINRKIECITPSNFILSFA